MATWQGRSILKESGVESGVAGCSGSFAGAAVSKNDVVLQGATVLSGHLYFGGVIR